MSRAPIPGPAGGRWLRLLGRSDLERLFRESLDTVLEARVGRLEARRLRARVLRELALRLPGRARRVRALTRAECRAEILQEHARLEKRREQERDELAALAGDIERARTGSPDLAPERQEALQDALASDLDVLLAARDRSSAVTAVVERERARRESALAAALAEERARTDILARRLEKLRAAQTCTEHALAELARRVTVEEGLPSVYRHVQGLAAEGAEREAKIELLRSLFRQNVALQRKSA